MDPARTEDIVVLATELIDLAIATRELERAAEGYLCRACPLLELGQVEEAKADLDQMATLAEQLRQPARTLVRHQPSRALRIARGQLHQAPNTLIAEALEHGERAQRWNARITHRLQLFLLRDAQGRLAELSEIYDAHPRVVEFRTYRIFDCVLARFYDKLGRRDDARAKFEELAVNDFAGVPIDEEWLASICLLAETAASLGDATRGYCALRPC